MGCPYFEENALCRCGAVRGQVVPSLHERERFCTSDGWRRCPTFVARIARGRPLAEDDYWALWIPSAVEPAGV